MSAVGWALIAIGLTVCIAALVLDTGTVAGFAAVVAALVAVLAGIELVEHARARRRHRNGLHAEVGRYLRDESNAR